MCVSVCVCLCECVCECVCVCVFWGEGVWREAGLADTVVQIAPLTRVSDLGGAQGPGATYSLLTKPGALVPVASGGKHAIFNSHKHAVWPTVAWRQVAEAQHLWVPK